MEVYPGVHQIRSLYGGRNLFQYLFLGSRMVLVDSGIAETPERAILPYIEKLGRNPADLSMMITTHPDGDHQGGNWAMLQASPGAMLACGEEDRRLIEDPACLQRDRYNYLMAEHGLGFGDTPSPDSGKYARVDIGLRGGERISINDGWELEVLHVPGHSHGHLALFDPRRRAAFVSDAVHGRGCPSADGGMALPVTYFHIELYLSTLRKLEALNLEALHSGHWPSMFGDEVRDFLGDSRHTVERMDSAILRGLRKSHSGLTCNQLIDTVREEFPDWPDETRDLAMFSVYGHMERLEQAGQVQVVDTGNYPRRWRSA